MQARYHAGGCWAAPGDLSACGVGMVCRCLEGLGFGCTCEPGEEDSYAGGVPRRISGNLSSPVSWEKKMVSGSLTPAKNDGFMVCGWERVMT